MTNELEAIYDPNAHVLAIDVCGTLYDANTTAGFVQHHHHSMGNRTRGFLLNLITGPQQPLRFACILLTKLIRIDVHRNITIFTLRGQNISELERSARAYAEMLDAVRISEVHERVGRMRDEGWAPVLVSNSIDLIISQVAKKLDVPYISSRVGCVDGRCTGKLDSDLTGRKRMYLESYLNRSLCRERFSVITDNRSDTDLIEASENAILISHTGPKKWMEKHNAEVVQL